MSPRKNGREPNDERDDGHVDHPNHIEKTIKQFGKRITGVLEFFEVFFESRFSRFAFLS